MAKTTGPLLSQSASGAIAGPLTFSTWKGRPYVNARGERKASNTPAQTATRAMLAFLASQWKLLTPTAQATWPPATDTNPRAPYNHFIAENLRRWRDFKAPSQAYPATEQLSSQVYSISLSSNKCRTIRLILNAWQPTNVWAFLVLRYSATGQTRDWQHLVRLLPANPLAATKWWNRNLTPGIYWYYVQLLSTSGGIAWDQPNRAGRAL
jgi:hypothetical protein